MSSEDQVISNDEARVYECIACSRGFSSAQALGGHMNIHRKDKAKIKHRYCGTSSIDGTARLVEMIISRVIQHNHRAPPLRTDVSWRNDNEDPS
ncbi:hypothetical protein MLD38_017376 [Melastoma candidum]|uniref:Uncharacterized protein n=1 Tax=Melastoma candidum TaxID=119954 RepID=A0ACB9QUH9_9MYRT|nr:hypothetical protein MLD38_017376 [Melastoma candidum]